ncbi:unnamed protein product [Ranitomeya imitator]|uniref:Glucans biosynthesis protein G n=1 Tax=Ranitomeya imitator TaxID=111125 RepID=A0ABN9LTN3_9NEOB|nr:unnamed protein product [Ranitomeya imitator]
MMKMSWLGAAAVALSLSTTSLKNYEAPKSNLPSQFREMKYADYQQIQFNRDKAYWNKYRFAIQIGVLPSGMLLRTGAPVTINEVTATTVFKNPLYPLNSKNKNDEIVSMFLVQAISVPLVQDKLWFIGARPLLLIHALPSGEEFPRFREFWIEHPQPGEKITYYVCVVRFAACHRCLSLLDCSRAAIRQVMGEWIWRPLNNPKHLAVSSFAMDNPVGFDLDNRYDLRPSAWVTPTGKWGKGRIELVEIPTNDETNDNIVAYWTPDQLPEPVATKTNFMLIINAYVIQTRRSAGDIKV